MLFEQYKRRVMAICLRYSRNYTEAEDMLQEAFVKVFSQLDRLQNPQALTSWISSIAVRTAINYYRKNIKNLPQAVEEIGEYTQDTVEIKDNMDYEKMLSYLHALPDQQRIVFNLFALEGYRHKEIATMLGIQEASSRVYLNQARKRLQKMLHSFYQPPIRKYGTK